MHLQVKKKRKENESRHFSHAPTPKQNFPPGPYHHPQAEGNYSLHQGRKVYSPQFKGGALCLN